MNPESVTNADLDDAQLIELFAELLDCERELEYWQASMLMAQRRDNENRANFDAVSDAHDRRVAELRKLIHDESHEVSAAQQSYLESQYEILEISKHITRYEQQLRELKSPKFREQNV